ncbi:MAG: CidA/LrgA family protein [Tissierellia bacterium]|nr:CidA/LrgA family protein [Tissierellia bacterium]
MKRLFKIIIEIIIIYIIYICGNLLNTVIKPIINMPGSLIGMIILLSLLFTGLLKLEMVEATGNFLLKYMGFFFIPLTVGIIETYVVIKNDFIIVLLILFISCIIVMFVTCKTTDYLMSIMKGKVTND